MRSKKIILGISGLFIVIILIFWTGMKNLIIDPIICKKTNKVEITNFSHDIKITITPNKHCDNLGYLYTIKGKISDSLIIDNRTYKKGKIDTTIHNIDYYGKFPVTVEIKKNLKTKGVLKITQKIL